MTTTIEPGVMQQIIDDWSAAPRKHKGTVVAKWAAMIGVAPQTIYRKLPTNRQREGKRRIPGIEEAARIIAQLKNAPPDHRGVISTEDAVKLALRNAQIDSALEPVSTGTWDRVMRELGLSVKRRRVERYQAERPNQMHHVDASTSSCLYIAKALPDGDYLLKLHRGTKDYKNKPIPVDGLRPWIYGLTDDHSGVHCCRYVAAKGENARHNMEFITWAWYEQPEKCFWGVPERIKGDHGPMMESPAAKDFFARCGVEIDPSTPLNKDAHGKIERPWRTLWQKFELPFFAMSDWKRFEITLSELNQQLMNYSAQYNERPHRFERTISRRQAWERISLHGGVVILPDDALETIAKSDVERKVGQDGVFWMDNIGYEVKGLHDAWVKVIVGVFDKSIVVQDVSDGRKYEVESFRPNALGEYRANTETGQEQVRKEATKLEGITIPLYAAPAAAEAEAPAAPRKVVKIRTRVKQVLTLENPLSVDAYPDMATALLELQGLVGFYFTGEDRAAVIALLEENGLSRSFVANLATDIEQERMRAAL